MQTALLDEIFIPPAKEILSDRFISDAIAAPCTGRCQSGHCMSLITDDAATDARFDQ